MACQSIDETTSAWTAPPADDIERVPGEISDDGPWTDAESLVLSEPGPAVAGAVPNHGEQRYLHDRLNWPGDMEGEPPWSVDSDGYAFNDSRRLTWCLQKPSTQVDEDGDLVLSEDGTRSAIQDAADEWFWNAGFYMREVECEAFASTCTASIYVQFLNASDALFDRKLLISEGPDPEYANASSSPPTTEPCTTIYVNDEKSWTLHTRGDDWGPPFDVQSTLLHEMGHALGICHPFEYVLDSSGSIVGTETSPYCTDSTEPDIELCEGDGPHAVMCPFYDGTGRTLEPDDVDSVHDIYGPSSGVCDDGYRVAYEVYRLIGDALQAATTLHEDWSFHTPYEAALEQVSTANHFGGKLKNAAEEGLAEPGFGLVATRYIYETRIYTEAAIAEYRLDADGEPVDDALASHIVAMLNETLLALPTIFELEDYCYVEEYGEHEDGR